MLRTFSRETKKNGEKNKEIRKKITREIVLNRDDEAESCEESQSP